MSDLASNLNKKMMAAAVRLARRHEGQTGANPSVACILVREETGNAPSIIATGITATSGRPHAETIALEKAGNQARGATAYVTLEPCAHHGKTPPCADALIKAGVKRVVTGISDPDKRVAGKGHAMLKTAGIEVKTGLCVREVEQGLFAYLSGKRAGRAGVTLKMAHSRDGFIGIKNHGQVKITGTQARAQSHLLRATHHAILVGIGTIIEDDPSLTCRLPGLENRSPVRIVLDPDGRIPLDTKLVKTAHEQPSILVMSKNADEEKRAALVGKGVEILPCELVDDKIDLPKLLKDLHNKGIHSVLVEGGAKTAETFLSKDLDNRDLVDRLVLFSGKGKIAGRKKAAIASPLTIDSVPEKFVLAETLELGEDQMFSYFRCL